GGEPVNGSVSPRGSPVSTSPTSAGWDAVTTLTTPGGMSVSSATIFPIHVAEYGVSGAGFNTLVHPAASAGASFDALSMNGKFHGVMRPATPIGSLVTSRFDVMPKN